jgi:hypothetical protein
MSKQDLKLNVCDCYLMTLFPTVFTECKIDCPHVSFENPHAPDEAVPRRSVETRSVVISKLESSYQ